MLDRLHPELTNDNFVLYAAKYYDNPQCHSVEEFLEDLKRFKYIKKLFTRYETTNELKEKLILNHVIVLNNVFGPYHVVRMFFLKIPYKHLCYLKPFLVFLDILPEKIYNIGINKKKFDTNDISLDQEIVDRLRDLLYGSTD